MYLEIFENVLQHVPTACRSVCGPQLRSLALFGSVARGAARQALAQARQVLDGLRHFPKTGPV